MTGWRLGWITAPAALAPFFEMLTEYNIAGPPASCSGPASSRCKTASRRGDDRALLLNAYSSGDAFAYMPHPDPSAHAE